MCPCPQILNSQTVTATPARLHYNASENNFVLVYTARVARFVGADLTVHDCFDTNHTTIITSAWIDSRQELVTAGSDGSIQFFATRKHYHVGLNGRQLIPSFAKRMTIKTEWR